MKRLFLVGVAFFLCFGASTASSETVMEPQQPWTDPYPLKLDGSFAHGAEEELLYTSHITGLLNVAVKEGSSSTLECEFRTGIGKYVKGLSIYFMKTDQENRGATGSFPSIITAPWVNEKDLNAWLALETEQNPALTFSLAPMTEDAQVDASETFPLYTNHQKVLGKIFVLDRAGKKPYYRYYSQLVVPEYQFYLTMHPGNLEEQKVTFEVNQVFLEDVSEGLWGYIRSGGNEHLDLPETPSRGEGFGIKGLPYEPSGAADTLSSIGSSVESMHIADVLAAAQAAQLLGEIDDISKYGGKTDPEEYVYALLRFEGVVDSMREALIPAAVDRLLLASHSALATFIRGGSDDLPEYTPSDPSERVDWYVDAASDSFSPDGSAEDPFPSIADALEAAESGAVPGLNLQVHAGIYREPLVITRDTAIVPAPGELPIISGSIRNETPALLTLSGVHLIGAEANAAVGVWNDDARTMLTNVTILDAQSNGIYHRGGALWLTGVIVRNTHSVDGEVYWSGAGIVVTGGCLAVLNNVVSSQNDSNGIVVDDASTHLWGNHIEIDRNHVNRYYEEEIVNSNSMISAGMAALSIQYGAGATLNHVSIRNNEFEGILLNEGSAASITDLTLSGTYEFVPSSPSPFNGGGGNGVRVRTNSYAEITDFLITDNDLAGLAMFLGGEIDLHNGAVTDNPIGADIRTQGFDTDRLTDRVIWDNDSDLDVATQIVPET